MFKAVTSQSMAKLPAEGKATLTAMWKKKAKTQSSTEEIDLADEAPPPEVADDQDNQDVIDHHTPDGVEPMEAEPKVAEADLVIEKPLEMETLQNEQELPADDGNPAKDDRKRKRPSKNPEQVAALEILFTSDPFPSKPAKQEVATKVGLDYDAVNNWFDKRRKQARADGTLVPAGKRQKGRPTTAAFEASPEQALVKPQDDDELPDAHKIPLEDGAGEVNASKDEPLQTRTTSAIDASDDGAADAIPIAPAVELPSHAERAKLLESLIEEGTVLRARGLVGPLMDISLLSTKPGQRIPFTDAALAAHVAGQRLPLSKLVTILLPVFEVQSQGEGEVLELTADALRSRIIDIAARRCHDPVELTKGAAKSTHDALEAFSSVESAPCMWQWELRRPKILVDKAQRTAVAAIKRRALRVAERLAAVDGACKALVKLGNGDIAEVKAAKALETLGKAKTLDMLEAEEAAAAAAKASVTTMTVEEKEHLKKEKEEEKERMKAEKEAEKERLKAEKEAEKERLKAEKEAEKERLKVEKEAEKERKIKEAQDAKVAKKTGFKGKEQLNKTANKFMSFFKATPAAKATDGTTPTRQETSPQPVGPMATPNNAPPQSEYEVQFRKPPPEHLVPPPQQPCLDAEIDAALLGTDISADALVTRWTETIKHWATMRLQRTSTGLGLPPSWARRPGAVEAAEERSRQVIESGTDPSAVRTWRRKFIWCPSDSTRPPYYGSWPEPGPAVGPRRPLGKDETLDYEVLSDLEWEEEPEGSSLSGADSDEAGAGDEVDSGVEDSFMVADGYLSEDEGVRLEDDDDLEANGPQNMNIDALGNHSVGETGSLASRDRLVAALHVQLERARRAGKPLVVLREGNPTEEDPFVIASDNNNSNSGAAVEGDRGGQNSAGNYMVIGDRSLLEALSIEILVPGVSFTLPLLQEFESASAEKGGKNNTGGVFGDGKAVEGDGAHGVSKAAGRTKGEQPNDLIPTLEAFIVENATLVKQMLVDRFMEAHADRKMTKKWLNEKITELAERVGSRWKLRTIPKAPAAPPAAVLSSTQGPQQQEQPAVGSFHQQQGAEGLYVPDHLDSTQDEFWMTLLERIENSDGGEEGAFASFFQGELLNKAITVLPAFILTALITCAQMSGNAHAIVALRCLRAAAEALVRSEKAATHEADPSSSQRAWGEARSGPKAASLEELAQEPGLGEVLNRAMDGTLGDESVKNDALAIKKLLVRL